MRFGVPWGTKKGIRPEARETAAEAARRSGMSLDDWLNSVIMQQAAQAGVPAYGSQAAQQSDPRALAAVNNRLDLLNRRIEQFTQTGTTAYAPRGHAPARGPDQRADLIGRLDQYVHNAQSPAQPAMRHPMPQQRMPAQPPMQRPPGLDQALADIAARQQMLNGGAPVAPRRPAASSPMAYAPPATRAQQAAHAAAPVPAQDLSGLEEQLRQITNQIETLRHPGVEEAINALRAELGEIGHALGEAMPRHSIDTIERQIQGLSQRIAEGRQAGVDHGALAGIEHGLTEVRDALRGLTPAESLVGFNEAVAGLAHKIDLIVAEKDPETLAQLESAITTLRGMANHVASNDTVSALAAEVQALTDKVDYLAHAGANADALTSLEHRIDALGQALAERAQNGAAVPPRLEALVQSLTDKIEQIQAAQQTGGELAGGPLDDRISTLVQRLDASDSRIGQLEAIERGLSDLLLHIEQKQAAGGPAAQGGGATADALKYDFVQAQESLKEALKNDLVHSQADLKGDIARTQDALDQVHGTLGELVQRLATIEQSIRSEARAHPDHGAPAPAYPQFHEEEPPALTQPVGRLGVRLVDDSAPGMAAFDDMLPPSAIQRVEPEPLTYEPIEPEPVQSAPPIQHDPDAIMDLEHATIVEPEHADFDHDSLPPAPQLEVTYEALRAHAAAQAAQAALVAPVAQEKAPEAPPPEPQPTRSWAPDVPTPKRIPPGHRPINPDLPPDEPLEPGSGPPPLHANPAARIAASEAALGGGKRSGADGASGGKSSFIAAARRAAQAAMQHEPAQAPRAAEPEYDPEETDANPRRKRMMRRVKSLFVATSIIAIVVGSVQIAATMLNDGKPNAPVTRTTKEKHLSMDQRADATLETTAQVPPHIAATPLAVTPPGATIDLFAPPDRTVQMATVPTPDPRRAAPNSTDITGSIPEAAANTSNRRTAPASAPAVRAEDLPIAIGGQRLRDAAATGDGAAAYEVAMRFAEGRGVPTNLRQAARWYERAASKGLAPAQFRLASLLEKGQGVQKDLARARALYFSAARQGNAKAMHNLAVLYAEGIEGKPDYATAVQWFRDAAQHGVSDSQYNLGILYARGIGVEKSMPESYKWFALAAQQGDKEATKKRDQVAGQMDAKTLATARSLAAKFKPVPQPQQATAVPAPPGGWGA